MLCLILTFLIFKIEKPNTINKITFKFVAKLPKIKLIGKNINRKFEKFKSIF